MQELTGAVAAQGSLFPDSLPGQILACFQTISEIVDSFRKRTAKRIKDTRLIKIQPP